MPLTMTLCRNVNEKDAVATKLKCLCLRKVDLSVRLGETEPGAAVRRPSDRSAGGPGVPALDGTGRPGPNGQHGLSSGQTSGSSGVARPDPPRGAGRASWRSLIQARTSPSRLFSTTP